MTPTAGLRRAASLVALVAALGGVAAAQSGADLARDIERRFDVLLLREGVVLQPKNASRGYRSIEVTDAGIAIDGQPVTGSELRDHLGPDAELVLRLSYLDAGARRELFARRVPAEREAPPAPAVVVPPPIPEAPLPPTPRPRRDGGRSGDRVRFGGSVTVRAGEFVAGDIVAIGGSARIDGTVDGDVVAIGGSVDLGPDADVRKDVVVVGGQLRRAEGARVGGEVNEVGFGAGRFWRNGEFQNFGWWPFLLPFGSAIALMSTMVRLAVLALLGCLVVLFAHDYVERVGARAAAEPVKAGIVGFVTQLLLLPILLIVILVLVITIIGIPLLLLVPFALLALVVLFFVGFTAVAHHLGRLVRARMGWAGENPYATALLGFVVVLAPVLLARVIGLAGGFLFPFTATLAAIGFALEYVAWTVGIGAVALLRFEKRAA
jgi:hypothetical protein